jgi:hypothetical protein
MTLFTGLFLISCSRPVDQSLTSRNAIDGNLGEEGYIDGGNSGGGTDGGYIGGDQIMHYTIVRACTPMFPGAPVFPDFKYFAQAQHPILILEATIPGIDPAVAGYTRLGKFVTPSVLPSNIITTFEQKVVIASQPLEDVNITERKYSSKLSFNIDSFAAQYPKNYYQAKFNLRICNDRNQNGRCDIGEESLTPEPLQRIAYSELTAGNHAVYAWNLPGYTNNMTACDSSSFDPYYTQRYTCDVHTTCKDIYDVPFGHCDGTFCTITQY